MIDIRKITLLSVPSQKLSYDANGLRFDIRLFCAGEQMCFDLDVDGERVLSGVRVVAGEVMIPYRYVAPQDNFAIVTPDDVEPDWREFSKTQFMVYGHARD